MDHRFMELAVRLALDNVRSGRGGPFGAVVVRDGRVVALGRNEVTLRNDPTAHAEIQAIRAACETLGSFQLEGCELYSSCEPCPMCLGAIYWARPKAVYYACGRDDAAAAGFDDRFIYDELALPDGRERKIPFMRLRVPGDEEPFFVWMRSEKKIKY